METLKGFLKLVLIIFLTIFLLSFLAWYLSLALAIFLVVVIPAFAPSLKSTGKFEFELDDTRDIPSIVLRDKKDVLNQPRLKLVSE